MAFLPAKVPFDLWIGNHTPITRAFKSRVNGVLTPLPLTGKSVFFTVFHGDVKIIEKSTVAGTIIIQGDDDEEMTLTLTPDDTRLIAERDYAPGESPIHEIEIRSGSIEQTWVYGKIKLLGGDNVDA